VQRQVLEQGPLVRPLTPLYSQRGDVLQRQVNGMISGEGAPRAVMSAAQDQSEVLVASASGESVR